MIRGCFLLLLLPLLLLSCPLRQVGSNRVKTFTGRPSPVLLSCSRARNFNFVWYCSPAIRIKIPFKGGGPQLKFFSNAHTQTRVSNAWKQHFYPRNGNEFVTNLIRNGKVSTNERIQMFRNNIFIFFFSRSKRILTNSFISANIYSPRNERHFESIKTNFVHRVERGKVRSVVSRLF